MKFFVLIGIVIILSGCDYKIMSKKARAEMIMASMIEGYKIGQTDCGDNLIPQIVDYHLRDLDHAQTKSK